MNRIWISCQCFLTFLVHKLQYEGVILSSEYLQFIAHWGTLSSTIVVFKKNNFKFYFFVIVYVQALQLRADPLPAPPAKPFYLRPPKQDKLSQELYPRIIGPKQNVPTRLIRSRRSCPRWRRSRWPRRGPSARWFCWSQSTSSVATDRRVFLQRSPWKRLWTPIYNKWLSRLCS